ncbi:branched-chain amino acid transport system ATP-binding protein [Rhizobium sp. SG_E_25_P2]|uniref:ABC transporter ATP-binding protein n=1 Tax=Rhizobium sp. SG_E_25_P2 TaxID=2879942 RepID=UPI0024754DFF|nr:ABC transporter ATP-binding protein [Rhizobium sp. SG_E_25_P2]MDH6266033.1 branched-chain amino acid transport system ATP-binding protein [Rhizobium sp. SG_E_25_P2]
MALLEVKNLNKSFGSVVVADHVDLNIDTGECIGVIGPNGAGKSSLFALIAGSLTPDSGAIHLDGRDISQVPAHKRVHLGIGRAFQIPQPFPGLTVFENVAAAAAFGARLPARQGHAKARDVLDRTGLIEFADRPAGSLTLLNRKRLELAKALAVNARLLMLDEIGAGLTEREVDRLVQTILSLKQDHAIIWIEHIAHALKAVADRIAVLHFGRKLLDGAPDEVMSSATVKEIYMGLGVDEAH